MVSFEVSHSTRKVEPSSAPFTVALPVTVTREPTSVIPVIVVLSSVSPVEGFSKLTTPDRTPVVGSEVIFVRSKLYAPDKKLPLPFSVDIAVVVVTVDDETRSSLSKWILILP